VAKVRVYELAKEFGVESKAVMAKLGEMGEFVRSASSTIEAPVVRRLKEAFAGQAANAKSSAVQGGRQAANGRAQAAARADAPDAADAVAEAVPSAPVAPAVPATPVAPVEPAAVEQPRPVAEAPPSPAETVEKR